MSASIADPFVLSTYVLPQNASNIPNVYATRCVIPERSEEFVVVTAQADGVHILDSSALHPVVSRTFGPSTTFSCASVVRSVNGTCTTYAIIDSAPEVPMKEKGRALWSWTNDIASGVTADHINKVNLPHPIAVLHAPTELPNNLVAVSPSGDVTILPEDLKVVGGSGQSFTSVGGQRLVKSYVFSRNIDTFVSSRTAAEAFVVLVLVKASRYTVRVLSVYAGDCSLLGDAHIPDVETKTAEVSMSPSGMLTILSEHGTWNTFQVTASNGAVSLSRVAESLQLRRLSFSTSELSILGISSSFVLLATLRDAGQPELIFHLWDMQYSVLVASQTMPLPASLPYSRTDTRLSIHLVDAAASSAILVLTPKSSAKGKGSIQSDARTSVYVVPFTVPRASSIAGALGYAAASSEWIQKVVTPAIKSLDGKEATLAAMRAAMTQKRPQTADEAFLAWREAHADTMLDRELVKQVLEVMMQPENMADVPYSPKVVQLLLREKVVSSNMLKSGLLPTLQRRRDWASIRLAMRHVLDIPESDIVLLLQAAVSAHRQRNPNEMHVDSTATTSGAAIPPLPTVLADCVHHTSSPAALRVAFRQHLRDADDVVCVLDALAAWMTQLEETTAALAPALVDLRKNAKGVPIPPAPSSTKGSEMPPLELIIAFLQPLLDASFLALLQHAAAHRTLRRISRRLAPAVAQADALSPLQAPLVPFVLAQARAERDGPGRVAQPKTGDWRKRRKAAHEQASLALGAYQVEELVL